MAARKNSSPEPADADMPDLDEVQVEDIAKGIEEEEESAAPAQKLKKKIAERVTKPAEEGLKLVKRPLKEAPIVNKVHPRKAYILDKKGQKQPDPDEKGAFLAYEPGSFVRHVGYVNRNGVLFPVGFRFKGGHIADQPEEYAVVLNKCPKCGHRQTVDEAVQGECQNMKVKGGEDDELGPCGFSAFEELDSFDLEE